MYEKVVEITLRIFIMIFYFALKLSNKKKALATDESRFSAFQDDLVWGLHRK
jgi:hypothetical protein